MNTILLIILAILIVRFIVIPPVKWYGRSQLTKPVVYSNVTEMFADDPSTSPKWKHIRRGVFLTGIRNTARVNFIFLDGVAATPQQINEWSNRVVNNR